MHTIKRLLGLTVCGLTLLASAVQAEQRELRVYNWADYPAECAQGLRQTNRDQGDLGHL